MIQRCTQVGYIYIYIYPYLTIIPCLILWLQKEQSELGELEWLADIDLFGDQLPQEALSAAEVPQLPIPQSSNTNLYRPTKYSVPLKKPRIETPDEDDEFFTVPDLG